MKRTVIAAKLTKGDIVFIQGTYFRELFTIIFGLKPLSFNTHKLNILWLNISAFRISATSNKVTPFV